MRPFLRNPPLFPALLALASLALGLAVLANVCAGPARRLSWWGPGLHAAPVALAEPDQPSKGLSMAPVQATTPLESAHPLGATAVPKPAPTPVIQSKPQPSPEASSRLKVEGVLVQKADQPVRELSSALAEEAFRACIPFLDARRSADFEAGHIAGAWCLPVWEADLDARITLFEAQSRASGPDPLVIYCNGGDCEDSHLLADRLLKLGYRNLWIYRAGYPDWVGVGRPIQTGVHP